MNPDVKLITSIVREQTSDERTCCASHKNPIDQQLLANVRRLVADIFEAAAEGDSRRINELADSLRELFGPKRVIVIRLLND